MSWRFILPQEGDLQMDSWCEFESSEAQHLDVMDQNASVTPSIRKSHCQPHSVEDIKKNKVDK